MKLLLLSLATQVSNAGFASVEFGGQPVVPQPVTFNKTQSSYMVLQRAPAKAQLYGMLPINASAAAQRTVSVTMTSATTASSSSPMPATIVENQWSVYLPPTAAGGDYTFTATCTGCFNKTVATIQHVTFGDVWYCSGQSNMWLPMAFSFSRNDSRAALLKGEIANIRVAAGDSQESNAYPWVTGMMAAKAVNLTTRKGGLFDFSAACWYFAESLARRLAAEAKENNKAVVPIGILDTAIGGTMIEQWTLNSTSKACRNISLASHNEGLYDTDVVPYLSMTVKGFVWYQGENNMHGLKGNSLHSTGYGCMMPAMVRTRARERAREAIFKTAEEKVKLSGAPVHAHLPTFTPPTPPYLLSGCAVAKVVESGPWNDGSLGTVWPRLTRELWRRRWCEHGSDALGADGELWNASEQSSPQHVPRPRL